MSQTPAGPEAGAEERPGRIDAVPVRHPGRWLGVAIISVLVAMFVNMLITNEKFNWPFVFESMFKPPVINGLLMGTLVVTALAMLIGVTLGVLLAVMRLSPNPVLSGVAFAFVWFFRGVPRLVLLTIMGSLGILFIGGLDIGIPFDQQILGLFGIDGDWRFLTLDANQVFVGVAGGAIGLGLSEAAYMAEIARAGILSVDSGQTEAAEALGMDGSTTMRRIVLPQAMRVIVPPTGNELISMVKDTSLLIGVPVSTELFFQLRSIGSRTYEVFPVLVAACIWYLIIGSILMVGQYYLERYFNRGYGARRDAAPVAANDTAEGV
ncbi:amino acid ABC transporter permease [Ornithinicoccus hortensis]|uniref:Polar amino acid transport system permease protein n=1 Tax=Ornithinicoccus hortensis TaxID=82346 RepID=A0A542YVL0_9MICO|nr:amino acid ABC transporter permease [Ornithinicoccus hortensis]TQL52014.1 polar amino acid transport system permease protein [Ornithinicoccus hortensis]